MPKNKGAHKYLLVLEIFCAVINFRTFHAMSRHLWFYDVTQFKLYWKIRNLEIRIHHHVSVLDWIPYTSNDSSRLQVHSTASLKKNKQVLLGLTVDKNTLSQMQSVDNDSVSW